MRTHARDKHDSKDGQKNLAHSRISHFLIDREIESTRHQSKQTVQYVRHTSREARVSTSSRGGS